MKAAVVNENGEVVNIIVADASVDTVPGFVLINAPDDITTRHIWTGTEFVPNAELATELAAAEDTFVAEAWETFE